MNYDYLIIGCGLYGAVCARELKNSGFNCLIIDKKNHIGGNCYTDNISGINVHKYGPHVFHTSDKDIWDYINKYAKFNNFVNRLKLIYNNKLFSFPLNLFTFYQIYGCKTPDEAHKKLEEVRVINSNPINLEEWILDKVGKDIYEIFIKGYTIKQWGRHPKDLPASIIKRIPIRFTFNDNYFNDYYQGIPIGGYTLLFENLLQGIETQLETNYFSDRGYFYNIGRKIIYTGSLDEFFDYKYGVLKYRTLRFDTREINIPDYQGNAVINYSNEDILYTRITEHKHFESTENNTTIITKEYPEEWDITKERLYPINDAENETKAEKYRNAQYDKEKFIIGGRLGNYKYYDMDDVISLAISTVKKEVYG